MRVLPTPFNLGHQDATVYGLRRLVVDYLLRAEQALKAVLEQERDLRTLARHLVRRYLSFKLENAHRGAALRSVFVLADGRDSSTSLLVR